MAAYLSCLQTQLPDYAYPQAQIEQFMLRQVEADPVTRKYLRSLYRQSGIETRHSVLSDFSLENPTFFNAQKVPDTRQRMNIYRKEAINLSKTLLHQWQETFSPYIDLREITHLVWVSCTGLSAPGIEVELRKLFTENAHMQTTAFNFLGCHGFFHALRYAQATSLANPDSKILVICLELCTLHFQPKTELDDLLANSLFADGAAAFVVSNQAFGPHSLKLGKQTQHYFHEAAHEMAWDIGLSGFEMKLHRKLPNRLRSGIQIAVNQHFDEKDKYPNWWIAHPGGKKILQQIGISLNLSDIELSYSTRALSKVGNVSSASVLFALSELWSEVSEPKGHPGLFIGVGPGLAIELASFEY